MLFRKFRAALSLALAVLTLSLLAPVAPARAQLFTYFTIRESFEYSFREHEIDGDDTSPKHFPIKADIRKLGTTLAGAVSTLFGSQAAGTNPGFLTQAILYSKLAYADGTLGTVWKDTTLPNNGVYLKVGASGSGSWSQLSNTLFALPPTLTIAPLNVLAGCVASTATVTGTTAAPILTFNIPACGINGPVGPTGPQGAQVSVPGPIYATTAAGLAGTTNGQYFAIPSPTVGGLFDFYLNNTGAAVLKGTTADESQIVINQAAIATLQSTASQAGYNTGDSFPGVNVGTTGSAYFDTTKSLYYPQRTVAGWSPAIPYTSLTAAPPYAVDFRFGTTFPGIAFSRATIATNAYYTDAPGAAYQSFAANRPVVRADLGMGNFIAATNYFLGSTTPATQTITLTAGDYVMTGNGTGTLAVAAGTATCTGCGTIATLQGGKLNFTVTAGTVTATVTGTANWAQIEGKDFLGRIGPTPLIVTLGTAVTRAADEAILSGTLLSTLQGTSGTMKFETAGVSGGGVTVSILSVNAGREMLYFGNSTKFNYYDGTNYFEVPSGTDFATGRHRAGVKWSPGQMKSFAGPSAVQTSAWSFNNGVAVTSAHVGGIDTYAQTGLNGWLVRIEAFPYEQTDADFVATSSGASAGRQDFFSNYSSTSLPKYRLARSLTAAGISDTIVVVAGDSTSVGTVPATNFRTSSWPAVMAGLMQTQLASQGITRVSTDSWFGYSPNTATPSVYDTRITESGTTAPYGLALGGDVLKLSPGARRCFAPTLSSDSYRVWYYNGVNVFTSNPYGQFTITDGVGGTVLATVNATSTPGLASSTVTYTAGAHTLCINAVGETHISGARSWLSTVKEIAILVISRSAFATSNFVQGGGSFEGSFTAAIPGLGANAMIDALSINDANNGATPTQVYADKQTLANTVMPTGDMLYMTGAPTNFGVGGNATAAVQIAINAAMRAAAYKNGAPFIDMYARYGGAAGYATYAATLYYDTIHFNAAGYADMAPGPASILSQ